MEMSSVKRLEEALSLSFSLPLFILSLIIFRQMITCEDLIEQWGVFWGKHTNKEVIESV